MRATLFSFSAPYSCKKLRMLRSLVGKMLKYTPQRLADSKCLVPINVVARATRGTALQPIQPFDQRRSTAYTTRVAAAFVSPAYENEAYENEAIIGSTPFNPQLSNCVSLMGYLATPVQVRPAGNYRVGTFGLNVYASKGKYSWHDMETWGVLADVAAAELKKGDNIQIVGKLKVNEWMKDGERKKQTKVVVNSISRVINSDSGPSSSQVYCRPNRILNAAQGWSNPSLEASPQLVQGGAGYDDQTAGQPGWDSDTPADLNQASPQQRWDHLVKNYREWYDNRVSKRNPKAPDFKHKASGVALWLNTAPAEAAHELDKIPAPQ